MFTRSYLQKDVHCGLISKGPLLHHSLAVALGGCKCIFLNLGFP